MNLDQIYQSRINAFGEKAELLRARYNRYSIIRLIIFIAAVGCIIFLWSVNMAVAAAFALAFVLAFGRFIRWHHRIQQSQIHHEHLREINRLERLALAGDISAFGSGQRFIDPDHPYGVDLDIFGEHSFFQMTNRTATALGEAQLARYLMEGADNQVIGARQQAIAQLKDRIDWRQHFQAYGMVAEDQPQHFHLLKSWLESPSLIVDNGILRIAMLLLPPLITTAFIYVFLTLPWAFLLIPLVIPLLILRRYLDHVNRVSAQTNTAEKILAYYSRLILHAEEEDFPSGMLHDLRQVFILPNQHASRQISRLSYLITQLNVRNNAFVILLNIFGLWDLQWTYRLEKWKRQNRDQLLQWFDALAELEALSSLATTYFNHPEWIFPSIREDSKLTATDMGHPLILRTQRVSNDLEMPTDGHIKLITGSNMAGKSTWLRTVGLNIVLAMIGAPVCARELSLPMLRVYTSMRTQDALHENTSSFYAELKRLKFIIDAVENGENIFFLLDEILKGTNSRDRHAGAKALIYQLIANKGSGLVATHDLELGEMAARAGGSIENLCMEVEVRDGKLIFDYKIKKGISQSFNATHLMREMGIKV